MSIALTAKAALLLMGSVESSVKHQFARVFRGSDWHLFKKIADSYFRQTAFLLKRFRVACTCLTEGDHSAGAGDRTAYFQSFQSLITPSMKLFPSAVDQHVWNPSRNR